MRQVISNKIIWNEKVLKIYFIPPPPQKKKKKKTKITNTTGTVNYIRSMCSTYE